MSATVEETSKSSVTESFIGRVKWFNNKSGYGFITITDGVRSGTDVFVHHSALCVGSEQYRYLVQGEYVEFTLTDVKTADHEFQAGEVRGIKGGNLMCETRRETRVARVEYRSSQSKGPEKEATKSAPVKASNKRRGRPSKKSG